MTSLSIVIMTLYVATSLNRLLFQHFATGNFFTEKCFSDNLSWKTWWANLSHRSWYLLLHISFWSVKRSTGLWLIFHVHYSIFNPELLLIVKFDFTWQVEENRQALTTLYSLESTISQRKAELASADGKPSWTKRLLLDDKLLCSKIRYIRFYLNGSTSSRNPYKGELERNARTFKLVSVFGLAY